MASPLLTDGPSNRPGLCLQTYRQTMCFNGSILLHDEIAAIDTGMVVTRRHNKGSNMTFAAELMHPKTHCSII